MRQTRRPPDPLSPEAPPAGTRPAGSSADPHPRLTRCAWIPLACLAVAALVLVPLNPDWGFNPPLLFAGLNLLFASTLPFAVAVLAGRAFLAGGSWEALLLGAGMLAFGLGSGLAGVLASLYGFNVNITVHNVGAFVAGGCHLAGALLATSRHAGTRVRRSPAAVLAGSYLAIGLAMGLVTLGAIDGFLPPFFIPGTGNTLLRNVVLGAAVVQLAISALLRRIGLAESRATFPVWYAYGLGLVALGLLAVFSVVRPGTPLGWVGRTAQYLGAVYILVAIRTVLWDYYSHGLSVGRVLAAFFGETRAQYRPLVESATDALVSLDADGTILFWNAAAQRLFGFSLVEAFGRDLVECIVAPEAAGDLRRNIHDLPRTPDGLIAGTRIERELLARSGRTFPAEIAFLGRKTPRGSMTIAVIRDITERKQAETALRRLNEELEARVQERTAALRESEERFAYALQAAQEGVWDWNLETNVVYYSPRYKQMLGYDAGEIEPNVSAWERLLHPDDEARVRQAVDAVMRGEREYEIEFRLRHKEGHYVHILSRGAPIRREADGPIIRIVGTHFDLTERKQAEVALRQAHDTLEQRVQVRTAELTRALQRLSVQSGQLRSLASELTLVEQRERVRLAEQIHDGLQQILVAAKLRVNLLVRAGDPPVRQQRPGDRPPPRGGPRRCPLAHSRAESADPAHRRAPRRPGVAGPLESGEIPPRGPADGAGGPAPAPARGPHRSPLPGGSRAPVQRREVCPGRGGCRDSGLGCARSHPHRS